VRRTAWILLVLFVFSIPWEYSLDLGAPYGNVARVLGLLTVLAALPAVLEAGSFRRFSSMHWLTSLLYLWFCCSFFWTETAHETLTHLRGYAQEMMLVWLVWEFVDLSKDLYLLLRAWLAGSWILAILTIVGFVLSSASTVDQVRFAAIGQDPNDVARFLSFGFPIAMLLLHDSMHRTERALWLFYFPVGFAAVLLTASRSGLLAALVALTGTGIAAFRRHAKGVIITSVLVGSAVLLIWGVAPVGTFHRLGTIAELWQLGDLNQRVNIWSSGWRAFHTAPLFGHGVGSFVTAAELGPEDTAHNTVISILVEGGLCGLALASAIIFSSMKAICNLQGSRRFGLSMLMIVWAVSSIAGTVWENRLTWLLFGVAAVSSRLAKYECTERETLNRNSGWIMNEAGEGAD
jgi:O-antigen ligase